MTDQEAVIAQFRQELRASGVAGRAAITIGTFDGVHQGHQQLLRRTVEWATAHGTDSLAITFHPHPRRVLKPDHETLYLMPVEERLERIRALGVSHVALVTFSRSLSQLLPEEFMGALTEVVGLAHLVAGPDFALGRGRQGTTERLTQIGHELGYTVEIVPPVVVDGIVVSSTEVRRAVQQGDVTEAARLLGRPFALTGTVVTGDQRGRTIGFPTANLQVDPEQVTPGNGVYAVRALVDGTAREAVMNIGVRPSFGVLARTLEVHVLDFDGDLYGKPLTVEFIERLRAEQKFPSVDALVAQIRADVDRARALFAGSTP